MLLGQRNMAVLLFFSPPQESWVVALWSKESSSWEGASLGARQVGCICRMGGGEWPQMSFCREAVHGYPISFILTLMCPYILAFIIYPKLSCSFKYFLKVSSPHKCEFQWSKDLIITFTPLSSPTGQCLVYGRCSVNTSRMNVWMHWVWTFYRASYFFFLIYILGLEMLLKWIIWFHAFCR